MSGKRLRKQLAYALGFLAVLMLCIGGPLLLLQNVSERTQSTPSPTALLELVKVQSVDLVSHENTVDVVARLYNPNPRAGIAHFRATFVLKNKAGQEITRVPVDSHVLPGSLHYISALNVPVEEPVAGVTLLTPPEPRYANLDPTITLPSFSTALLERTTRSQGGEAYEQQKGVVTNNSAFDWQHVQVVALAFNGDNQVVGVGTTFVGRLTSGEQREFTLSWPAPLAPTVRVVPVATTNIFKEDNIIRAVGDPALLR